MNQAMEVLTSMVTVEWYTPPEITDRVRLLFGGTIDLDPASCEKANEYVQAYTYYALENGKNGLDLDWYGNVFLNPPFSDTVKWINKAYYELKMQRVKSLVIIVNSAPGYVWWENLVRVATVSCMLRDRVAFIDSNGLQKNKAKKGQTVIYFGDDKELFKQLFKEKGKLWE